MKTCPPTQRANIPSPSSLEMKPDNTMWRKRDRCCLQAICPAEPHPCTTLCCFPKCKARPAEIQPQNTHSPSGLRQKSVEAEPCSFWMVQRYTPQSMGDACTMAKAAGPSSPALQRVETLLVRVITQGLRPNSHSCREPRLWEPWEGGERFQVRNWSSITQVTLTCCVT